MRHHTAGVSRARPGGRRILAPSLIAPLLATLLASCGRAPASGTVAGAPLCIPIGGARPEALIDVTAPRSGLLHVALRERGLSVVGWFERVEAGEPGSSGGQTQTVGATPVERLGTLDLARDVERGQRLAVHVSARDAPQLQGVACVTAEVVPPSQRARIVAEQRMAQGANRAYGGAWQEAFADYASAARLFDSLGLVERAALARHMMAQLDHGYLGRVRDSYALICAALAARDARDPAVTGARLELLATVMLDLPGNASAREQPVQRILLSASHAFGAGAIAQRELPRLAILEGFASYESGDLVGADQRFAAAAAQCRRIGDSQCFATARQDAAVLAEEEQNYMAAMNAYEEALKVLDPERTPRLVAHISDNLGRLAGRVGLFDRSEQMQRAALAIYARLGDCEGVRRSASSLGELLVQVGSIGDAETYLGEIALECRALIAAQSHIDTGSSHIDTGSGPSRPAPPAPARLICTARVPAGEIGAETAVALFRTMEARGEMALLERDTKTAARCLQSAQVYALEPRTRIALENARGALLLAQERGDAALGAFRSALELADAAHLPPLSGLRGSSELGLARALLLHGDLRAANTRAFEALDLSGERGDVAQLVGSLRVLAAAEHRSGDAEQALRTLSLAVRLLEQVPTAGLDAEQRALYLATQHDAFAELTEELLDTRGATANAQDPQRVWSAFLSSEEGRGRSLRYALGEAQSEHHTPDAAATAQYRGLVQKISAVAQTGDGHGPDLLASLTRLPLPEQPTATLSARELQGALRDAGAALIEYAAGPTDMFAFVIDGEHIASVRLGSLPRIEQVAAQLREDLRSTEADPGRIGADARRLAALVLWPVNGQLTGHRVLFAPDEVLFTVPFAVLPWSAADPHELVLNHAESVSIASAELFARASRLPQPRAPAAHFVLLGDPVFRANVWWRKCATHAQSAEAGVQHRGSAFEWMRDLPSLPGSLTEVNAIADLIERTRTRAGLDRLLQCEATPAALRSSAPQAQLLHIATHGLVDARRPRLSALALTPDSPADADSAFRLPDILALPLRTRLVVLSACDTSGGRLLPGEGVMGLAQAFLQAGAQSVVASYWRVPDDATARFMEIFYHYLLAEHLPAAAALRRAQLDTMHLAQLEQAGHGDAYSWAAFALYGLPDAVL